MQNSYPVCSDSQGMDNRPPRILHLIHWFNSGGIENWLLAALQHVPRSKFAMDVCYKGPREGELAARVRKTGAQLHHCPLGPTVLPFVRRLKAVLRSGRYALLHVHTGAHSGPAVYAATAAGVPVVTTFHSTDHPPQTWLTRLPGVQNARAVYARRSLRHALRHSTISNGVSKAVAEAVTKAAALPQSQCEVFYLGCKRPIPNSVDRTIEYRRELHLPHEAQVIVHVGNFRRDKNQLGVLQVLHRVRHTMPNVVLLLVGDGELRADVQAQISQLKLDQHVRLMGKRSDATALMQLGNLFLFPSYREGLSVALMEASSLGLPIVASDILANREATDYGASARLHNVADIDGMAASVVDLLSDSTESQQLAERGREIFDRIFSIESSVERLAGLYNRVLRMTVSAKCAA
jgi:glycosyltransferase involved in cell wall biosynthesis